MKAGVAHDRFAFVTHNKHDFSLVAGDEELSGLVLNFVSDPQAMATEMVRVTRPGGTVGAYVWDYGGGMQMLRHFWDAAVQVNPHDSKLDQAERFPTCQPEPLETLFRKICLNSVSVRAIDVATVFRNFDDYWTPFLGKQGAAPTYLAGLDDAARNRIRDTLKARIATSADRSIALTARAWAVSRSEKARPARPRARSGHHAPARCNCCGLR